MACRTLPDLSSLASFDERLREVATDAQAVEAALAAGEAALGAARERGDVRGSARLVGYLGKAHRMLGRPGRAITYLQESVELAQASGDARTRTVARIRLGELTGTATCSRRRRRSCARRSVRPARIPGSER